MIEDEVSIESLGEEQEATPAKPEITLLITNVDVSAMSKPHELLDFLGLKKSEIDSFRFRSIPVEPQFHKIPRVGVLRDKIQTGVPCHMYVVCKSEAALAIAMEKNTAVYKGRHLFMTPTSRVKKTIPFARLNSVFVGRLPQAWTEDHLYELFQQVGEVTNVRLVRHPVTHQSQKFGYVEFKTKAAVGQAIKKLDGSEIKTNHKLRVQRCLKATELQASQTSPSNDKISAGKKVKSVEGKRSGGSSKAGASSRAKTLAGPLRRLAAKEKQDGKSSEIAKHKRRALPTQNATGKVGNYAPKKRALSKQNSNPKKPSPVKVKKARKNH